MWLRKCGLSFKVRYLKYEQKLQTTIAYIQLIFIICLLMFDRFLNTNGNSKYYLSKLQIEFYWIYVLGIH